MNAYIVHDGHPDEYAVLVFSDNESEAIEYAKAEDLDIAFIEANPIAWVSIPNYIAIYGVCNDTAVQRKYGFWCDGDDCCGSCGLYEMDGKFPVCEDCGQCEECMCEDQIEVVLTV